MSKTNGKNTGSSLAVNRKARHNYFIEDTYEAGLVLKGVEIKSMRDGKVNLRDSFVIIRNGEAWVQNMHVAAYEEASTHDGEYDPTRPRKLLLHKREIQRLDAAAARKGMTLIPLKLYLKNNRAKLQIGLAKGKKLYDKRATMAERDSQRQIERALRERY